MTEGYLTPSVTGARVEKRWITWLLDLQSPHKKKKTMLESKEMTPHKAIDHIFFRIPCHSAFPYGAIKTDYTEGAMSGRRRPDLSF